MCRAALVGAENAIRPGRGDSHARTCIQVTDVLLLHQPKVCTHGSITLPPDAGAKFRQNFAHETDKWHRAYATLRNSWSAS